MALGLGVNREAVGAQVQADVAARRDLGGGGQGRRVRDGPGHLRRALEIELVGLELHAAGAVDRPARLDAEQGILGPGMFGLEVVHVIGGHQGNPPAGRQFEQGLIDLVLLGQFVGLDFQVEAPRENLGIFPGRGLGPLGVVVGEALGHLAVEAGGQGNEAAVQLLQKFLVHPGAVVEALQMPQGHQSDKILIALIIFRQQHQVVMVPLALAVVAGPLGYVDLAAQNRLDARGLGLLVEIQDPEERAVVGDGHRRHFKGRRLGQQVLDAHRPIQQTVGGMDMKMDELRLGHGHPVWEVVSGQLPVASKTNSGPRPQQFSGHRGWRYQFFIYGWPQTPEWLS